MGRNTFMISDITQLIKEKVTPANHNSKPLYECWRFLSSYALKNYRRSTSVEDNSSRVEDNSTDYFRYYCFLYK